MEMEDCDGFEGNAQSLRIITEIAWSARRNKEPIRTGIEPTQASVESILKHQTLHREKIAPSALRSKFLYDYQSKLIEELSISKSKSLECQIMDIADDIGNAFIDFTDGVREEIITLEALVSECINEGKLNDFIKDQLPRRLNSDMVGPYAITQIGECVKHFFIETGTSDARTEWRVALDKDHREFIKTLSSITHRLLFSDPEIQASDNSGAFIIRVMFETLANHYCERPSDSLAKKEIIPKDWHHRIQKSETKDKRLRLIADFISGMTDDYAQMTFDKLIQSGSACFLSR
jgi:dGTPase